MRNKNDFNILLKLSVLYCMNKRTMQLLKKQKKVKHTIKQKKKKTKTGRLRKFIILRKLIQT